MLLRAALVIFQPIRALFRHIVAQNAAFNHSLKRIYQQSAFLASHFLRKQYGIRKMDARFAGTH
jgi:hypothetical protein